MNIYHSIKGNEMQRCQFGLVRHSSRYSSAARSVLLRSYHVLMSYVRCQSTDARQNGIYFVNNNNKGWMMMMMMMIMIMMMIIMRAINYSANVICKE